MIGPLTYVGWLAFFAVIALWVAMFRFGRRSQWMGGAAFTVAFILILGWFEWNNSGPPMFEDPYGPMLFAILIGPIFIGWLLFALALLSRRMQQPADTSETI